MSTNITARTIQSLTDELERWLNDGVDQESIIKYVSALPSEGAEAVVIATATLLKFLGQDKARYFNSAGAGDFCALVGEPVQFNFIEYLSEYDSKSVLERLKSETKLELSFTAFPADVAMWSKAYLTKWRLTMLLAAAPTYLKNRIYAESLLKVTLAQPNRSLVELKNGLMSILERENKYEGSGQLTSQNELNGDQQLLNLLGFLPEEITKQYTDPNQDISRYEFIGSLVDLVILITSFGLNEARAEPERFDNAVWEQLYGLAETSQLDQMEANRLSETKFGNTTRQFAEWLHTVWTLENIQSGMALTTTETYYNKLTPEQRREFKDLFELFASRLTLIATAFDPVAAETIVVGLRQAEDIRSAHQIFAMIDSGEDDEEFGVIRLTLADEIWKILHLP